MSIVDRFLNAMKLNPDYEDYDDYDDYYDDDDYIEDSEPEEEKKPKWHFFFHKNKEEETGEEYAPEEETRNERASRYSSHNSSKNTESNVLPMRRVRRQQVKEKMQVCIIKPTSVEDAREITETLLDGKTVLLNMEGLNLDVAQRIIDFTSGSCYAISGNLQKVSNFIFVLTPPNVEISGDIQDLLGSADTSSSVIQANM